VFQYLGWGDSSLILSIAYRTKWSVRCSNSLMFIGCITQLVKPVRGLHIDSLFVLEVTGRYKSVQYHFSQDHLYLHLLGLRLFAQCLISFNHSMNQSLQGTGSLGLHQAHKEFVLYSQ